MLAVIALTTLAAFAGSWTCAGTFANGTPIASTLTMTSDFGGTGLIVHQDDVPPGRYHAVSLWAPVSGGSTLADASQDVTGAVRIFTSSGFSGDTLLWQGGPELQPHQRFRYQLTGANAMRVTWETARTDDYRIGDTLDCTRG